MVKMSPRFSRRTRLGRIDVEFGALRVDAFGAAVLEGGESGTVLRDVGIGAIGIEGLADHQDGFAMRAVVAGLLGKIDVGGEGKIAGEFLPDEVEAIGSGPEIDARGGDGVGACGGRVSERAGRDNAAHIGLALKDAERTGGGLRGEGIGMEAKDEEREREQRAGESERTLEGPPTEMPCGIRRNELSCSLGEQNIGSKHGVVKRAVSVR